MTALQFIEVKKAAIKAYGEFLDSEVTAKSAGVDRISELLKLACLDAFGLGFDAAFKACEENPTPPVSKSL